MESTANPKCLGGWHIKPTIERIIAQESTVLATKRLLDQIQSIVMKVKLYSVALKINQISPYQSYIVKNI